MDEISYVSVTKIKECFQKRFSNNPVNTFGKVRAIVQEINGDIKNHFNQLSPDIKVLQDDITLLGGPLNVQSTAKLLNQKHDEMKLLFSRLKFLQSHMAYFLLRNCFSIPKLTYLLRTSPAWAAIEIINAIDRSIEVAFEFIYNILFDEQQWCIASLPIKFGGLGLRKASDIMLSAFLASVNSVLALITLMLQNITDGKSFAVKTLGPWSNSARNFVNELGHTMMVGTEDARSKQFFIQRISLAIQRGNAASVMGTFPPSVAIEEIFLL
ncbi:hypothetical protein ILUMI_01552 [Ignelater luminosus]|uniref:Uncharacterized protein n=1 Tax=Ignelater luminosus TaxID=2038154 RepID=A0A8K0DF45_IGNLU|nr:hypothetical protein ILUMI_01552 [Ignelater luminosus]